MADVPIRSGKALAGLVAVVALLASTVTVVLADQFTDVNPGNFFAPSIDDITDAGCAGGYPDGTFKPKENPTREQFALWTSNCFGRSSGATNPNDAGIDTVEKEIDAASMDVAGFAGKSQYLHVSAWFTLDEAGTECPCEIRLRIRVTDTSVGASSEQFSDYIYKRVEVGTGGDIDDGIAGTFRFTVPTGNQYTIQTMGQVFGTSNAGCAAGNDCLTLSDSELSVWTMPMNQSTDGLSEAGDEDDVDVDAQLDPSGNPNG